MYGHTHYFGSSHISKIHWWRWAPPLCIYTDELSSGRFFHVWKFEQNTGEKIMLLLVSWRRHLPNNPRQIISLLPSVEPTLTYIEASQWRMVCVHVCLLTSFLLLWVEQCSGVEVTISFEKLCTNSRCLWGITKVDHPHCMPHSVQTTYERVSSAYNTHVNINSYIWIFGDLYSMVMVC